MDADEPQARITIRYRSRLSDHVFAAMHGSRRSDFMFAVGLLLVLTAIPSGLLDRVAVAIGFVIFGLVFLTGVFAVPFVLWSGRGREFDVEFQDIIDRTGIHETSPTIDGFVPWSAYQDVAEGRQAFYLNDGLNVGNLPKRAFTPEQLATFRKLIREIGLEPRRRRMRRLLTTVGVLGTVVGLAVVSVALARLNPNPRLELGATVEGRLVQVRGTTDLPDDTLIAVEVIQVAEYSRSISQGTPASAESPWVRYDYELVKDGRFEVTFDTSPWPAGRARIVAFFYLSIQPEHVIDRYGDHGQRLSGPNVREAPDGGHQLEVQAHVELE